MLLAVSVTGMYSCKKTKPTTASGSEFKEIVPCQDKGYSDAMNFEQLVWEQV